MSEERPLTQATPPAESQPESPAAIQAAPTLPDDAAPSMPNAPTMPGAPPPPSAPSLFEPNRALGLGLLPDDLPYVNEVDAALHRGAGKGTVRLSLDDALLIEARVRPADVAFLRPKQQAMVKISAYDFATFGDLPGELV